MCREHLRYLMKDILGDKVDLRFYNNTKRSFHAKSYMFENDEGGEIFIGSSNLSKSALTSGIEWNYRIDKKTNEEIDKIADETKEVLKEIGENKENNLLQ